MHTEKCVTGPPLSLQIHLLRDRHSYHLLIKNVETRRGFKNSKKLESTPSWTHGTSLIKAHISDRALEALKAVVSPGDLVVQKKLRGTHEHWVSRYHIPYGRSSQQGPLLPPRGHLARSGGRHFSCHNERRAIVI